jgi:hypothetical protein
MTGPSSPNMSHSDITLTDDLLRLRKEDLAALTRAYMRESRGVRQWAGVAGGIGGLVLAVALIAVGERLGWPTALGPYFFIGGWAIMLGCGIAVWRRERRLRQQYHLACPACDDSLLDGIRDHAGLARVELVIATGVCPKCGAHVLAP